MKKKAITIIDHFIAIRIKYVYQEKRRPSTGSYSENRGCLDDCLPIFMNEPVIMNSREDLLSSPKRQVYLISRAQVGDYVVKIRKQGFQANKILIERYRPVDGQLRGTPRKRVALSRFAAIAGAEKGPKTLAATYQSNLNPKGGTC